jgi:hypothetical protein
MDKVMAFLMKYIGGFFTWWEGLLDWPVSTIGGKTVKWSFVAFWLLIVVAMVLFLPGGLLF